MSSFFIASLHYHHHRAMVLLLPGLNLQVSSHLFLDVYYARNPVHHQYSYLQCVSESDAHAHMHEQILNFKNSNHNILSCSVYHTSFNNDTGHYFLAAETVYNPTKGVGVAKPLV